MAGGQIVLVTGPFGAPERQIALERPMTIAEAIAVNDLAFHLPTIAVMGGEPVMRGQWALRMVRPGETLAFVAVPGGGGGEGDISGKQILGLVAALALSIAAPMIGGALFGIGTIGASIASAAILAGGTMLLNALFAPPESTAESAAAADPIYSVTAASNQATPLDVVPVLYGELEFAPRYAARPYSEFAGNDQYLYQLFTVTAGKAAVKRIKIGETEAWNSTTGYSSSFSDLTFEIIQPGQSITLFPANVVTSAEVSGQNVPDPAAVLGPFVVNASGTTVDRLAVDFAFPGGLWTADKKGVAANSIALRAQYQQIDNVGAPIGGWNTLFAETISAATRTPQRMTRAADVAAARYQVRFLSDEAFDPDDGSAVNSVAWVGLRGYLTGFETPANTTLLAMRVRANEQLSQLSSSQIRVLAERHLPVWNGSTWVLQATRSIAWAAADILRNADYSLGLSDGQYDLAGLATLAATWSGRGDTFNAIFDRAWTAADALRAVLRAGRAQPVRIAGTLGFVRLQPRSIKRATFTQRNVIRGSFQHKLVLFDEEKPDSVIGRFIDAATWQPREVKAQLASVGGDAPQTIDWFGITDRAQVWRESVTEAAVNAYQREFVSFTADWEGKLLVRGDPILVQHPFVQGVQTASLEARSGDALTLDRDIDAVTGDIYVILRGKDGKEWGPCLADSIVGRVVTLNATDRAAVVSGMGSLASILPGARSERAHVLICDGEMRPFNGLVVSAVPQDSGKVEVLAVVDAPEIYLADQTETMPSPYLPPVTPPVIPLRPMIVGLYAALRSGVAGLELDAMWQPAPGATLGYVAEVSYDEENTWTPIYAGMGNRFSASVLPQPLVLRVAAVGGLQGPWVYREFDTADLPPGGGYIDVVAINDEFKKFVGILAGPGSLVERLDELRDRLARLANTGTAITTTHHKALGVAKAEFTEQLTIIANETEAAVDLTTLLLAQFGDNVAVAAQQIGVTASELYTQAVFSQEVAVEYGGVTVSGLRTAVAMAGPDGWEVKIADVVRATGLAVDVEAGTYTLINSDGQSMWAAKANKFAFLSPDGTTLRMPVYFDGTTLHLTDTVVNGDLVVTGTIRTDHLQMGAVLAMVTTGKGPVVSSGGQLQAASIYVAEGVVRVDVNCVLNRPSENPWNYGYLTIRILRNGSQVDYRSIFFDDNFAYPIAFTFADYPPSGQTHTYSVDAYGGSWSMQDCVIGLTNHKRIG
ncbi:hypothetical protein ASD80_06060 [Devosia sp. Root635]|nr:hypothetical protein ASD80_06060 [Devosia sp. Root635]